jgi:hypothetical protein
MEDMFSDIALGGLSIALGTVGIIFVYYALGKLGKGEFKDVMKWVFFAYLFALAHMVVHAVQELFFPGEPEVLGYLLFLVAALFAFQSGRALLRFAEAYGFAGEDLGKDPYEELAESMVRAVYALEGHEAIAHANSVKGLKVDENMGAELSGDRRRIIANLIEMYGEVYGRAAQNLARKGAEKVLRKNELLRAELSDIFGAPKKKAGEKLGEAFGGG